MTTFEHFAENVQRLEKEIELRGVALRINWSDDDQVRALAREALDHTRENLQAAATRHDPLALAKAELFGLAALMLKTMEGSASVGFLTHGGPAWKAFGRALWAEAKVRDGV